MSNTGQPTVVVNISPAGHVMLDAQCFVGANCEKATEQLELVLGGQGKKTRKPEYYATGGQAQHTSAFDKF